MGNFQTLSLDPPSKKRIQNCDSSRNTCQEYLKSHRELIEQCPDSWLVVEISSKEVKLAPTYENAFEMASSDFFCEQIKSLHPPPSDKIKQRIVEAGLFCSSFVSKHWSTGLSLSQRKDEYVFLEVSESSTPFEESQIQFAASSQEALSSVKGHCFCENIEQLKLQGTQVPFVDQADALFREFVQEKQESLQPDQWLLILDHKLPSLSFDQIQIADSCAEALEKAGSDSIFFCYQVKHFQNTPSSSKSKSKSNKKHKQVFDPTPCDCNSCLFRIELNEQKNIDEFISGITWVVSSKFEDVPSFTGVTQNSDQKLYPFLTMRSKSFPQKSYVSYHWIQWMQNHMKEMDFTQKISKKDKELAFQVVHHLNKSFERVMNANTHFHDQQEAFSKRQEILTHCPLFACSSSSSSSRDLLNPPLVWIQQMSRKDVPLPSTPKLWWEEMGTFFMESMTGLVDGLIFSYSFPKETKSMAPKHLQNDWFLSDIQLLQVFMKQTFLAFKPLIGKDKDKEAFDQAKAEKQGKFIQLSKMLHGLKNQDIAVALQTFDFLCIFLEKTVFVSQGFDFSEFVETGKRPESFSRCVQKQPFVGLFSKTQLVSFFPIELVFFHLVFTLPLSSSMEEQALFCCLYWNQYMREVLVGTPPISLVEPLPEEETHQGTLWAQVVQENDVFHPFLTSLLPLADFPVSFHEQTLKHLFSVQFSTMRLPYLSIMNHKNKNKNKEKEKQKQKFSPLFLIMKLISNSFFMLPIFNSLEILKHTLGKQQNFYLAFPSLTRFLEIFDETGFKKISNFFLEITSVSSNPNRLLSSFSLPLLLLRKREFYPPLWIFLKMVRDEQASFSLPVYLETLLRAWFSCHFQKANSKKLLKGKHFLDMTSAECILFQGCVPKYLFFMSQNVSSPFFYAEQILSALLLAYQYLYGNGSLVVFYNEILERLGFKDFKECDQLCEKAHSRLSDCFVCFEDSVGREVTLEELRKPEQGQSIHDSIFSRFDRSFVFDLNREPPAFQCELKTNCGAQGHYHFYHLKCSKGCNSSICFSCFQFLKRKPKAFNRIKDCFICQKEGALVYLFKETHISHFEKIWIQKSPASFQVNLPPPPPPPPVSKEEKEIISIQASPNPIQWKFSFSQIVQKSLGRE